MAVRRRMDWVACAAAAMSAAVFASACPDDRLIPRPLSTEHDDAYDQAGARLIDILWVVDNSGSMADKQDALANSFYRFIALFARGKIDYRIGVTTTDVFNDKGHLLGSPQVIAPPPATADPVLAFQRNVHVGVGGKGNERGLEAARLALEEQGKIAAGLLKQRDTCLASCKADNEACRQDCTKRFAPNFMRPDAYLYVIVVTDEDDQSFGEPWYFARHLEQAKGIGNEGTVAFAAICGESPTPSCPSARPGDRYLEVVSLTGGISGTICSTDFSDHLEKLAYNAAGLRRRFPLTAKPDLGTLQVKVTYRCNTDDRDMGTCQNRSDSCDGQPADFLGVACSVPQGKIDGWEYESTTNSIYFNGSAIPGIRSRVDITYQEPDVAGPH